MFVEPADETWFLDTQQLGRRVQVYRRLDSTNRLGLALAQDKGNHGLVLLAREQSAGRGQHGRTWTAPADSSVLLSVLLFPPPWLQRPALLTAWAAVSVCALIQKSANLQARIKWPNDLLLQGRKVCGILIEQRADGQGNLATVAGIGLNVNQPADFFARADLPLATSLAVCTGQERDVADLARLLVQELDQAYHQLCLGERAALESSWKRRLGLLGRLVRVETADQVVTGRLLEATFDEVALGRADGKVWQLPPEAIRHLEPAQKKPRKNEQPRTENGQ